jgi:signal transduction histidine kinase/CheY-like chemotaxis protein
MNTLINNLNQSKTLFFWSVVIFIAIITGAMSVVLPMYYAKTGEWNEPELTIRPKNSFKKTLRVVGDSDYRPFSYCLPDNAEPRGYNIELIAELANRLEYDLDLKLTTWDEAIASMRNGEADLILGFDWQDMAIIDCNISVPVFEEKFVAFGRDPDMSFNTLYSKKIALIEGFGLEDSLVRYLLGPNCVEYLSATECVRSVIERKCDCFIVHRTVGETYLRRLGQEGKQVRGRMEIESAQMSIGIALNKPELYLEVNATLLAMRTDGFMEKLAEKWIQPIETEIEPGDYLRRHPFALFLTINLLAIIFLVILITNFYLIRIREERNRAIEAERTKDLFFSMVSHDIRTPLNAIIGFSELLKHGISDQTEKKQALDAITTSGRTLLDLVNDVLDLSKLGAGKVVLTLELTDLNSLAHEVMTSFEFAVSGSDVALEENVEPMPLLYLDPHRVRQILYNLIGNAVKFTDHGKVALSIVFKENTDGNTRTACLTISVSDTGCGIAPEDQENVLKPFVQAKIARAAKGTGLGLPICCQLAERMGGRLTLRSTPGKGSTFTVVLPRVAFSTKEKTDVEMPDASSAQNAQEILKLSANDPRVLIVDDVPLNMSVIKAMLRRLNVTDIITAENGAEALELLKQDDGITLVLTDMWMPVMDGEGLIREIRSREHWKDLPVYAVTADVETQKTFKASGFTGILLKPVTLEQLKSVIR